MWKRPDDAADAQQPKVTPKEIPETAEMSLEAASKTLIEVYRRRKPEQTTIAITHENVSTSQPLVPATMATYSEATNQFTKNVNAFMEQLPLFTKARDAYEQAMKVSAELRRELDAGDENIRSLMSSLEQALEAAPDRKKEPAKVEAIRANNQGAVAK